MACNICGQEGSGYTLPQPEKARIISVCDRCSQELFNQKFSSPEVCLAYIADALNFAEKYRELKRAKASSIAEKVK